MPHHRHAGIDDVPDDMFVPAHAVELHGMASKPTPRSFSSIGPTMRHAGQASFIPRSARAAGRSSAAA
jgi:hypothetical protein